MEWDRLKQYDSIRYSAPEIRGIQMLLLLRHTDSQAMLALTRVPSTDELFN